MQAYSYHNLYKEFEGMVDCQPSPLEPGKYLIPGSSTLIPVIDIKEGFARVFNVEAQAWEYVTDNRGKTIYNVTDSRNTSTMSSDLYANVPEGYTLIAPPDSEKRYVFNDGVWSEYLQNKEELAEFLYQLKRKTAYSSITIVKGTDEYIFETGQDSITMCNSQAIAFSVMPDESTVDWKVYKDGFPTTLTLTKAQFLQVFAFGMNMINAAFGVEGDLNKELAEATEEQMKSKEYIDNFKARAESSFGQIPKRFSLETLASL